MTRREPAAGHLNVDAGGEMPAPTFAPGGTGSPAVAYLSPKTFRSVALAANAPVRFTGIIAKATFTIVLHFRHSNAFANPSPGAFPWT
jgi:hypothetical protein